MCARARCAVARSANGAGGAPTLPLLPPRRRAQANDDLRQEQFAVQIIRAIQRCYDDEGLPLPLHTCQIVATAPDGGLVQVVTNAISLDSVKKRLNGGSLSQVRARRAWAGARGAGGGVCARAAPRVRG